MATKNMANLTKIQLEKPTRIMKIMSAVLSNLSLPRGCSDLMDM